MTIVQSQDLPQKLLPLKVRDFPGVGKQMELRLAAHGADTVAALWSLSPEAMVRAFGGVIGRHFWRNLHGEHVIEAETTRGSISHSNVLSPELRTDQGAYAILVRLVHKAAARLRHMNYAAGQLAVKVHYTDRTTWGAHLGIEDAQDTQTLLEAMSFLWQRRKPGTPKKVGMVLFDLEKAANLTLPLFPQDKRRMDLARAMDEINGWYGRQRIYFGEMHNSRHAAPMRIAFNSVPDDNW